MPIIYAELSGSKNSRHFASRNFITGYWECSLHPTLNDPCEIIVERNFCTHSYSPRLVYLQSANLSLLDTMEHSIKP